MTVKCYILYCKTTSVPSFRVAWDASSWSVLTISLSSMPAWITLVPWESQDHTLIKRSGDNTAPTVETVLPNLYLRTRFHCCTVNSTPSYVEYTRVATTNQMTGKYLHEFLVNLVRTICMQISSRHRLPCSSSWILNIPPLVKLFTDQRPNNWQTHKQLWLYHLPEMTRTHTHRELLEMDCNTQKGKIHLRAKQHFDQQPITFLYTLIYLVVSWRSSGEKQHRSEQTAISPRYVMTSRRSCDRLLAVMAVIWAVEGSQENYSLNTSSTNNPLVWGGEPPRWRNSSSLCNNSLFKQFSLCAAETQLFINPV